MRAECEHGRIIIEMDETDEDEVHLEIIIKRKEEEEEPISFPIRPPRRYIFDDDDGHRRRKKLRKRLTGPYINIYDVKPPVRYYSRR